MYGFIIFLHVVICMLLITIILMQSGRGGGLTESFSSAESLFGAKTNVVLVRGTTVLAILFLATCLSLAFLSTQRNKSLITEQAINEQTSQVPGTQPIPTQDKEASTAVTQEALPNTANNVPENANPSQPAQAQQATKP